MEIQGNSLLIEVVAAGTYDKSRQVAIARRRHDHLWARGFSARFTRSCRACDAPDLLKLSVSVASFRLLGSRHGPARSRLSGKGSSMPLKVGEIIKIIEADGWCLSRVKGSHRQFHHPIKPGVVTVAGKLSTDLPIGTERSILRQAGIGWRSA